jgi:hypothetical protein
MVSLPYVGCVAFDVKAKTVYGGTTLYFDASEVQRLATFADLFNIATLFRLPEKGPSAGPVKTRGADVRDVSELGPSSADHVPAMMFDFVE